MLFAALIFLSPLYIAGLIILFKDDQRFILNLVKRAGGIKSISPKKRTRSLTVIACAIILAIGIIRRGGSSFSIFIAIASISIYIYWERGESNRNIKRLHQRAEAEFPALVELISVLISAGEPPIVAMKRVGERAQGVLANDFQAVVESVSKGKGLTYSLEELAVRTNSDSIRRFADTLILALERGTSLSDVLARQVQEVRDEHQTRMIEMAGRAEIALMIPVIFLILPISILFALWPSYLSLGQSVFG
jgi:tight adherence protein C